MQSWWRKAVVYQIYPRSFCDSNGDGIGDIPGIISKLDYLKDLGVTAIWYSPLYRSPQIDHGYDISDYRDIAPEYGTMADCERLIKEMHDRDLKVIFDMVLNHTSDQHPWFVESRSSIDNPKRDWYIWREGRKPNGKKPPNNWISNTIGSAWQYDPTTKFYFYAMFARMQPDLNWRNPAVKQEMFDTLRFWLQKGVDGFRLDMISSIYEEQDVTKNHPFPLSLRHFPISLERLFKYNLDHPDTLQFTKDLRAVMDEFSDPERYLVGEVAGSLPLIKKYYGDAVTPTRTNGLNQAFHFQTIRMKLRARIIRSLFTSMEKIYADPYLPTLLSTNHDRMRRISRLGNDVHKAKLNATFQLTARGVPYVYYGEEIGMINASIPMKHAQDPIAKKYGWIPQFAVNAAKKLLGETLNRDEARTPMQWDASPNAGFSKEGVKTWLPVTPGYEKINVSIEEPDQRSLLNCFKRLLHLRKDHPALNAGDFQFLKIKGAPKNVLAYERSINTGTQTENLQVFLNFGKKETSFQVPQPINQVLFSIALTGNPLQEQTVTLGPFEGVVVQK